MKRKPTQNDVQFLGGLCAGLLIMYLMWWFGTGMEHPGLVFGGGLLGLTAGLAASRVSRSVKRGGQP